MTPTTHPGTVNVARVVAETFAAAEALEAKSRESTGPSGGKAASATGGRAGGEGCSEEEERQRDRAEGGGRPAEKEARKRRQVGQDTACS